MPEPIQRLQSGINERQSELQRVADVLAREAHRFRRRGGVNRVILIALGAMTATQAGLEQLELIPKTYLSLVFLITGVVIAVIAGIEAAFKFESKGAELTALAASCHSMVRQTDSAWYRQVGIESDSEKQVTGALQVIELQQAKLDEVQEKAATLGVNIALEVRRTHNKSLQRYGGDDDDDDDDDSRLSRQHRPYAA
jgi:hypothetical protein